MDLLLQPQGAAPYIATSYAEAQENTKSLLVVVHLKNAVSVLVAPSPASPWTNRTPEFLNTTAPAERFLAGASSNRHEDQAHQPGEHSRSQH